MEFQPLDTNFVIATLTSNLSHFSQRSKYDRYNLNKKIKKNDMSDITTQLAHLYCKSIISDNNIPSMNDETNDELLKQIEELKKENKQLKKQNKQLTNKKEKPKEVNDDEKVSKKKYQHMINLKNKNWEDLNEYKSKCTILEEKVNQLEHRLKKIKSKYNISDEDEYKNEVMEEEFSSDEEDEKDIYEEIERVDKQRDIRDAQLKKQEENKLSPKELVSRNKEELQSVNDKIKEIQKKLQDKEINEQLKKQCNNKLSKLFKKKNIIDEFIIKIQQEEENDINELKEFVKKKKDKIEFKGE